jgi:hypothetical protein
MKFHDSCRNSEHVNNFTACIPFFVIYELCFIICSSSLPCDSKERNVLQCSMLDTLVHSSTVMLLGKHQECCEVGRSRNVALVLWYELDREFQNMLVSVPTIATDVKIE